MYIVFPSAFRRGRQLEEATLGRDKHWACWNGDPSRIFVRKAGYNYGWDWGPTLMTGTCASRVVLRTIPRLTVGLCPAGPFRPVRIERYQVRIVDLCVLNSAWECYYPTVGIDRDQQLPASDRLSRPRSETFAQLADVRCADPSRGRGSAELAWRRESLSGELEQPHL